MVILTLICLPVFWLEYQFAYVLTWISYICIDWGVGLKHEISKQGMFHHSQSKRWSGVLCSKFASCKASHFGQETYPGVGWLLFQAHLAKQHRKCPQVYFCCRRKEFQCSVRLLQLGLSASFNCIFAGLAEKCYFHFWYPICGIDC